MAKRVSQESKIDAPLNPEWKKKVPAPSAARKKGDAREYDHRGVAMPRRSRIGGIIMPQ